MTESKEDESLVQVASFDCVCRILLVYPFVVTINACVKLVQTSTSKSTHSSSIQMKKALKRDANTARWQY